ncbi:uncharacterized protein LOC106153030 [Lingula anatina]|uniref:Uncharacterized protein LOC106153030 n=1 Tax=Lingula anatina TaxID=7574 RepID=A0A1S3H807_LINAN|nr:uncharacterized protein LOC106153030 [Lingula anatina]|eukprot:XP_013382250.1 uncharacterized protein LOC106153030 [Lingula anatina]
MFRQSPEGRGDEFIHIHPDRVSPAKHFFPETCTSAGRGKLLQMLNIQSPCPGSSTNSSTSPLSSPVHSGPQSSGVPRSRNNSFRQTEILRPDSPCYQLPESPTTSSFSEEDDPCCCNRSVKNIVCRACGHIFQGRVRRQCHLHPKTIHLMDMDCCPNCKATHLKEFRGSVGRHQ